LAGRDEVTRERVAGLRCNGAAAGGVPQASLRCAYDHGRDSAIYLIARAWSTRREHANGSAAIRKEGRISRSAPLSGR